MKLVKAKDCLELDCENLFSTGGREKSAKRRVHTHTKTRAMWGKTGSARAKENKKTMQSFITLSILPLLLNENKNYWRQKVNHQKPHTLRRLRSLETISDWFISTVPYCSIIDQLSDLFLRKRFRILVSNRQGMSSRLKRLESELSSEFVCFFDLQFFFTHPCALTFLLLLLVRFFGFLRLLRRFLRRLWSGLRFGSVTPTMGRSWTRARPRMATMRRTTSAPVPASSMRGGTRRQTQKDSLN